MYKSNINVLSNIYIRTKESTNDTIDRVDKDEKFLSQITDRKALLYLKHNNYINLNEFQRTIISEETTCAYGKQNEKTHGPVLKDGKFFFECRCENTACKKISECAPKTYNREESIAIEETSEPISDFKWLGISEVEEIFKEPSEEEIANEIIPVITENITADKAEYTEISAEEAKEFVIEAEIDSHILINAGPGTGKTYTAIQRIIYLLNHIEPEDSDMILVLCYTRAAVGEIKKRIKQGVADGTVPYEASNISVCTFDSLATNYLVSIGTSSAELNALDYNQRIQYFNKRINTEDFEGFVYCIIDELQDLVNDRATMALNIISSINCGFLLLGDKCQAIYDYDCKGQNSTNSTEFYKKLNEILPHDTQKCELIGNKRQDEDLAERTNLLRDQLLNFNAKEIISVFRKEISDIPKVFEAESYSEIEDKSTAILCRNNGEAEYVSWLLLENGIEHSLIRTNSQIPTFNRCLADVLWDYNEGKISKSDFIERLKIRCKLSEPDCENFYNDLCVFLNNDNFPFINCEELAKRLRQTLEFPEAILNKSNSNLTVSTIHKAKGREFDKVYLLDYDYSPSFKKNEADTEEERVIYVAETRPKHELQILKKHSKYNWYFKKNNNNRWIRTIPRKYKKYPSCVGFATGFSDDIDYSSFVNGTLNEAVRNQAYIARNIKKGDKISLRLKDNIYEIVHNDTVIGNMSDSYSENIRSYFGNHQYVYQLPDEITDLYISNIISFVSYIDYKNIPQNFRKNRFWLGIEISGFGKTVWVKN